MDKNIEKIKPSGIFTNYIFKTIPLAFDESMSYYETLCGVLSLLKTQEEVVNNNADLLAELESYVQNYFKNLDVQTEINNKLDEMAKSGELENIIASYINSNAIIGFNTLSDLKNSQSIVDGSFTKSLGKNILNDGLGALYKIRTITSSDIVDEDNIISLSKSNTLIGEKIKNKLSKKAILIGDSYAIGQNPDGDLLKSWFAYFEEITNIPCIKTAQSGIGFCNSVNGVTFETLLSNLTNDETVTDIVVCGGANDTINNAYNENDIYNAIKNFKEVAKQKFPNAKIHIGFIGWNKFGIYSYNVVYSYYNNSCKKLNIHFLQNVVYTLHKYFKYFTSDGLHPNADGQEALGKNIAQAVLFNTNDVYYISDRLNVEWNSNFTVTGGDNLSSQMNNGLSIINSQTLINIEATGITNYICDNNTKIELGTIKNGYLFNGTIYDLDNFNVQCLVLKPGKYYDINGNLSIQNGKLYISFLKIDDDGQTYLNLPEITNIKIMPFSHTFDSLFI